MNRADNDDRGMLSVPKSGFRHEPARPRAERFDQKISLTGSSLFTSREKRSVLLQLSLTIVPSIIAHPWDKFRNYKQSRRNLITQQLTE